MFFLKKNKNKNKDPIWLCFLKIVFKLNNKKIVLKKFIKLRVFEKLF